MDIKEFYQLIEKPTGLDEKQAAQLDKIIKEYPYFSSARLVKILNLIKTANSDIYQELEESALYLYDKRKIYEELSKLELEAPEKLKTEENKSTIDGNLPLPETAIERKDFTNEILNELTDLGKGIKATVLEEFKSDPSIPLTEQKVELPNSVKQEIKAGKIESKSKAEKVEKNLKSATVKTKASIEKTNTSQKSEVKETTAPKKDLADEVMENLARMREERELRNKNESANKVSQQIPKTETKAEKKAVSKKDLKPVKKIETPTKKPTEKINQSSSKSVDQEKGKKNQASNPKTKEEKPTKKAGHDKKIIESFINSEIKIKPRITSPGEEPKEDLSKPSTELPSNLVSENLANIFEKQGKNSKAIAIYNELILKYPEKKSYFAAKIQNLEK